LSIVPMNPMCVDDKRAALPKKQFRPDSEKGGTSEHTRLEFHLCLAFF
jgi:hypothetical protein